MVERVCASLYCDGIALRPTITVAVAAVPSPRVNALLTSIDERSAKP